MTFNKTLLQIKNLHILFIIIRYEPESDHDVDSCVKWPHGIKSADPHGYHEKKRWNNKSYGNNERPPGYA